VVWTDIPRSWFVQAESRPPVPGRPDPLAGARALLGWARANGISLVSVFEVFHAGAPMVLQAPFVLEMSKQLPRGFAAASDHLRVEIVHRFGGAYVDGDFSFDPDDPVAPPSNASGPNAAVAGGNAAGPLSEPAGVPPPEGDTEDIPAFFDRLAGSEFGFTLNPLGNGIVGADMLAAPARHPAISLWRECARLNYFLSQAQLFDDVRVMSMRYVGHPWQEHRYLTPHRSGRVHLTVLRLLRTPPARMTSTRHAFRHGRELSWLPPAGGEPRPVVAHTQVQVASCLAKCLTFLRWQLLARDGNLYLCAVDPVIRGLPDPDAAWIALLSMLSLLGDGMPPVTSVTDLRRSDDGRLQRVALPPEAEALLDRDVLPERWFGSELSPSGGPVWMLDEIVSPCALRLAFR
jgi:hypothetical protein